MKKNVSGQKIGAQMVAAADGSAFTGSVTVAVTGDAGTQAAGSVGSGACAHEGNGYHTYAPAQAETNYDLIAFTFTGTGAVPATVQVYTRPTTGLLAPATADRTLVVDAAGLADANAVKVGPTGAGTAQTARDLGNALPAAAPNANGGLPILSVSGTTLGYTVTTLTTYTGNTPQTGDAYAVVNSGTFGNAAIKGYVDDIGVAGAGLTALGDARLANLDATISSRTKPADTQAAVTLVATTTNLTNLPAAPTDWLTAAAVKADAVTKIQAGLSTYGGGDTAGTTTLLARLTATRAGYLDNLSAGAVALASGVTVATNNDKTGYSLTQAFPSNFAALSVTAGGKISGVVLVDTTTANTDMRGTDSAAPAATALSTAQWTNARAGYLDNLSAGAAALASQIPANFTAATFASAGVFSVGALANAPSGGGGGGDCPTVEEIRAEMDDNSTQLAAIWGKLNSGAPTITVAQIPPATGTTITLVQGDDYQHGLVLTWTSTTTLDVVGVTLRVFGAIPLLAPPDYRPGVELEQEGTLSGASGAYTFSVPLTHDQTQALLVEPRARSYGLRLTLSNDDVTTVKRGSLVVVQ